MFKLWEIDCVITKRNSKICRNKWRDSWVAPGQCLRTIHDIDDGFGGKTGACREYTLPRDRDDSEPVGRIRGFTKIVPCQPGQSHVFFLTNMELQFKQHPCWVMDLLDCDIQRTKPKRGWSPWGKRRALPMTKIWQVVQASRHPSRQGTRNNRILHLQDVHPDWSTEVDWHSCRQLRQERDSRAWSVSKNVTTVSRHEGLHRESDGAIDWCSLLLVLRRDFQNEGAGDFSDSQWLSLKHRGSDKTRFQSCLDSSEKLIHLRAVQRHSVGALVDPALLESLNSTWMEIVPLPRRRFLGDALHHASRACRRRKGRQRRTADCLPYCLGPHGHPTRSIRIYRNHERYNTKSKWKMTQDVMYWINSRIAEDKGLTFWQTRSRAFILYDSVPADCIEKLVSTKKW